jgi:antibiotic biosynthesis monooxygenase (ABM) superfamily enzyme
VIKTFNALPSKIPGILGYEAGTNVSKEGKSEGLTHSFVLTFKNMEDLDAYIAHPAHQAYVDIVKTRREKVVVFDYWVK